MKRTSVLERIKAIYLVLTKRSFEITTFKEKETPIGGGGGGPR